MISFEYSALRQVLLDADAPEVLPGVVDEAKAARVFVLASRTLRRETPAIEQLQAALGARCVGVFDEIGAHSPRQNVMLALQAVRDSEADMLMSVGGGSIIDAAKAIQFCINGGVRGESELLEFGRFSDGTAGTRVGRWRPDGRVSQIGHIAVPTTLSAAEYSDNAGLVDADLGVKEGYSAPGLCPQRIIYDPDLSRRTPLWLWLSTAVRSLDHAIEGYCSRDAHAYMQAQYLHAVRLFFQSLPATFKAPDSLAARSDSQQAAWLAGCALGKVRHGASHGTGYILGAMCGLPHGYTSCVMLPAVLRWNSSVCGEQQQVIARAMGGEGDAAQQLTKLLRRIELPASLRDVGLERTVLPDIAAAAARHPVVRNNPRPVKSAADVMEILELAW